MAPGFTISFPLPVLNEPELRISIVFVELSVRVLLPLRTTDVEIGVMFSATINVALIVLVPVPVKETLAKLPAPMAAEGVPVKFTVLEEPDVNVPELAQSPCTDRVKAPVIAKLAPVWMVIFLATEPLVLMTGWKGAVDTINTSVVAVGIPPHQLESSNQFELVVPSQIPGKQAFVAMVRSPESIVPK